MHARLTVSNDAYTLSLAPEGGALAERTRLPAGSEALIPARRFPHGVTEAAFELAIEHAENWLMPHARSLNDADLEVRDETGRISTGLAALQLQSSGGWTLEAFEQLFLDLVDRTKRASADVAFVADIVLIRELAHHGRVRSVSLNSVEPTSGVSAAFLDEVKAMLLQAVDATEPPGGLGTDEPLFGPDSRLDLDSLDGLQLSVAIQKHYGIRMADSKELRRALVSLTTLASHIALHKK